jgi:hypothetical protein
MSRQNPFLLRSDPYHENPFAVLGVGADANNGLIENRAQTREGVLERGRQPASGLVLQPGDCITAAEALKDPVLRLAFDLMHFGLLNTGEDL